MLYSILVTNVFGSFAEIVAELPPGNPELSSKCPEHVPDMSLGQGMSYNLRDRSDGQPYLWQNFLSHVSAACPQSQSCVLSSTWNEKTFKSTSLDDKFDSSVYILLPKFFFCNYKTNLIPKWKNRGFKKRIALQTQKCIAKQISSLSPLMPLLFPDKIHFFIFSFFATIWAHNFKFGWIPQPLLLATYILKNIEKMANDVRPWTCCL